MTWAFYDGQFVDAGAICIDPSDYGFSRGIALFAPVRVYSGVAFRLGDHLERFMKGAGILDIACPYSASEIEQAVQKLSAYNRYAHSTMHICMTAGPCLKPGKIGFADSNDFVPHLMIFEHEFKPLHPEAPHGQELYREGLKVKTVSFSREMPDVKLTNYVRGFLAARAAAKDGWNEILYTHNDGYVTEAPKSNFFCVINGILSTPVRGMLRGITRKVVLELASPCGITAVEKDLTPADIYHATEAFTASSFSELFPVRRIDEHILPTTTEGPVFSTLRRAFTNYIEAYCEGRQCVAA